MKKLFLSLSALFLFCFLLISCRPEEPSASQSSPPLSFPLPPITSTAAPTTTAVPVPTASSSAIPATTVPPTTAAPTTTGIPLVTVTATTRDYSQSIFLNEAERQELDALLSAVEGSISLSYVSLLNGESYSFQPDTLHYAASLVKVPYAYYLLQLCDRGECDLNQELVLLDKWKQSGTGTLKNEPEGTVYTVRQLLEFMITISDNTAFKILREEYPLHRYNRFCREELDIQNITYQSIHAHDMTKALTAVARYIEGGSENALFLKDLMARAISPLIKAPGAQLVLHKHGWADPAFHDMAIVYDEYPYLIVILSDHTEGTREDVRLFADLSRAIKRMQDSREEPLPSSSAPGSTAAFSTLSSPSTTATEKPN